MPVRFKTAAIETNDGRVVGRIESIQYGGGTERVELPGHPEDRSADRTSEVKEGYHVFFYALLGPMHPDALHLVNTYDDAVALADKWVQNIESAGEEIQRIQNLMQTGTVPEDPPATPTS